ncbi:hypothetical protein HS960_09850 [Sphingobacterium paramultivorum]|uniref:Uncharacterized protein n=1 Tax=Sphingobacterium paramultivorum TaxID=2886510 RepID=A0A7G5E1R6_9SPHI|nr:hypothetical protein [Sphingobacterium paramultivorum]QMV67941.1 hypothetical protein HS960_09850 [Sphingobacterium paramultivorum]WSO16841.1 hypothetical protein VUL84_09840 [Sphingobacterium paramultivorum]
MRYLIYILFSQILFLKTFAQGNFDKYGVNVDFIAEPNVTTSNGVQLFYNSSTDNNYKFKILARISRNDKGKSDQYGELTWLRLKYVTNGNTYVIADELILYFVPDGLNQSPYKEFLIEIPPTIQTDGQIVGEFYTRNGTSINEVKSANAPLITKIISGPSQICTEGIYTFGGPEPVSLENATNIATLTSLGNNQYKVTRIGYQTGTVKLKSTTSGKTFEKEITVGGGANIVIDEMSSLQQVGNGFQFQVLPGNANMKYTGVLKVTNITTSVPTTYSWSLVSKTATHYTFGWSSNGRSVEVHSKGNVGFVVLRCKAVSGCDIIEQDYTFYFGVNPND